MKFNASDRAKLQLVLDQAELSPYQREAFEGMLESLQPKGPYEGLTDKKRSWLDDVLKKNGLSIESPSSKNARVPRGREVKPLWDSTLPPLPRRR